LGLLVPRRTPARFEDSIQSVPVAATASQPHRVRDKLTAAELAENLDFVVSLRMRNIAELEARIQSGQLVPQAEMEAKYLPLKSDHDRVASWLKDRGFAITLADSNHTNLFARGSVAQISAAFDVTFARVVTADGEFSSAVTAPSLPTDIAGPVLGIDGLQPHIRAHVPKHALMRPQAATSVSGYFTPADIAAAYNAPAGITGAGQTIAIVMAAAPVASDLTTFWAVCGINEANTSFVQVKILGGPTGASQSADLDEVTLDTEWATAMAPGAALRVYETPTLVTSSLIAACTQILSDAATNPSIRVVSYSATGPESQYTSSGIQAYSQTFAQLAAAGITFIGCSGDGGSNPNPVTEANGYSPSNPLDVEYPASDLNAASVGGTTVTFNSNWTDTGETAWTPGTLGTGGGVSSFFSRPSWQIGTGVPSGTMRCVPDVAVVSNSNIPGLLNLGALIVENGQDFGQTGTSLSAQVWSGLVAVIEQERSNLGLQPLGLLGPWVYPLIGTNAFQDITTGNNGAYSAGVGYDLCTGVGTPNVANLIIQIDEELTFTTLAGAATVSGSMDGTGSTARFNQPAGVALDGAGNLYVADFINSTIRKVTPSGVVTTLAGAAGITGSADGTGATARFYKPFGVAADSAGNVYVADSFNDTIRTIAPGGVVTTLAGTAGISGSADGTGSSARFNDPTAVAVDGAGNLYVADAHNDTIRKITSGGVVTTVAGTAGASGSEDGTGGTAQFNDPFSVAVDSVGNVYVADFNNDTIRKIAPGEVVTTLAGTAGISGSANGTGSSARFNGPSGVAVDGAGNVYVADYNNDTIRKITPGGVVTTLAGTAGVSGSSNGTPFAARFDYPVELAVDGAFNVYVADYFNDTIRKGAALFPPVVTTQPQSQFVAPGSSATFTAAASGTPNLTYQWYLNGHAISGATGLSYAIPSAQVVNSGSYTVIASNAVGSATSSIVTLTVTDQPIITTQPASETINAGSNPTLSVTASGATSYQWQLNGANIAGATNSTLSLANIGTTQGGSYTVITSNSYGSTTSSAAAVTVNVDSSLYNISSRAYLGSGTDQNIVAGFYTSGSGSKSVVIGGIGPDLAVIDPALSGLNLTNPKLTLFNGSATVLATNMAWGGSQTLVNALASVYAPPLPFNSNDAAVFMAVPAGSGIGYTAEVDSANSGGTGIALVEVYDYDAYTGTPASNLINISTRAFVGIGNDVLVAGFWAIGSTSQTVLIRAVGPGLAATDAALNGLTLAKPTLTLYDSSGNVIATNTGWGNAPVRGNSTVAAGIQPATTAIMNSVYASQIAAGSADCAMVVTLPANFGYTAQVSGVGSTTGIALVEVYNVP
jgi:hypothetical protein